MHVLVEGQVVRHEIYGSGIIIESDTDRTTVDFEDHGTRKFVTGMWTAELIGEPPAKPPRRRRSPRAKKAAIAKAASAK